MKRSVRERVYLTPDEAAHLARLAEREGMSRSSYLGRVVRLAMATVSTEHWPNRDKEPR